MGWPFRWVTRSSRAQPDQRRRSVRIDVADPERDRRIDAERGGRRARQFFG